ncbi:carboxypeptidase-like regulatory domain-containing protein [bacterium]|nr:carboxypeptidase-like regulatory domain-containing protein [bacterium]
MKRLNLIWLLVLVLGLVLGSVSCGGGDGTTTPPNFPPTDGPPGGDPQDPDIIPDPPAPFLPPGGSFGDLRGVAASQQYVYVADDAVVYCYDKQGALVNFTTALGEVQGLAVFPPSVEIDVAGGSPYLLPNHVAVLHDPVGAWGWVTIYPPNLDPDSTREDDENPDPQRRDGLPPGGQGFNPPDTGPPPPPYQIIAVYDIAIDRFGSVFTTCDVDVPLSAPIPDFPRAGVMMNRFDDYLSTENGDVPTEDENGDPITIPGLFFHQQFGNSIGDFDLYNDGNDITPFTQVNLGQISFDAYYPFNRADLQYTLYAGAANFTRDYVGIGFVRLDTNNVTPAYVMSGWVENGFGYNRVIGESGGGAPGSFAINPAVDPGTGALEDPDLTAGGPSGMAVDPLTDQVYICDPGNRRVQVFDRSTGSFIRQIGTGARGRAGSTFLAPSNVAVDYEGNIYITDVNDLRYLQEKLPDRSYGNIGGTVRRLDNATPLEGASVSLGSELGTLAIRNTNINGDYLIRNLRTGTYYMTATKFNYDSDTASVQVLADTTVRADFNLSPRTPPVTGGYSGNIIDGGTNLYLSGVNVQVVGTSLSTVTDSIGHFQLTNLAPGTYQVVFTLDGYTTLTRDVEILAGNVTVDNLLQMTSSN